MSLRSLLARQLGRPSGLTGLVIGRTLNRVNARVNAVALDLLLLRSTDHLLDVGFGGGLMLQQALPQLTAGFAAGIDISKPMLKRARRVFRKEIRAAQLELKEASVLSIPYADEQFDKAASINTIHFWPDPPGGLRELFRVLKPGGLLVIALRPKDFLDRVSFTKHGFAAFDDGQLRDLIEGAGFGDVRIEHREDADMGMVVAVSVKPSGPHAASPR